MSFRGLVKKVLPRRLFRRLEPYGHTAEAMLAQLRYGFPARGLKIIGVTGTNGKTTTANLIASVLDASGAKVGLSSTAVFQIGDQKYDNDLNMTTTSPWSLLPLLKKMRDAQVDWIVLEVTSMALAQGRVWGLKFDTVVLTNISQDHLDYHVTMECYIAAKTKLFANRPRISVLNLDEPEFERFAAFPAAQHISYGLQKGDVTAQKIELTAEGSRFELKTAAGLASVNLQLPGQFNVYNALAAAAVGIGADINLVTIASGLGNLSVVPGRMEKIEAGQSFSVIVDYAHTPDALEKLFRALRQGTKGRLIAVFGATGDRDRGKRPLMGRIGHELCDLIILTDEEPYTELPRTIIEEVEGGVVAAGGRRDQDYFVVEDRREAIAKAFSLAKEGDTVVVSGMGHQKYKVVGSRKLPWDDRVVAREELQKVITRSETTKQSDG